jgi:hypothetical protein
MNHNKIILDLCGGSGSWGKPYQDAGYDVRLITLPHNDVLFYEPPEEAYGILAAPPCTEFSIVNRREKNTEEGMIIVNVCLEIIERCNPVFWALENPTGLLRNHIGKPRYTFQPWWFGDPWTKKTDIWGNFNIPEIEYFDWGDVPKLPLYIRPTRDKPSMACLHKSAQVDIPQLQGFAAPADRDFRAITPPGFAKAFFTANQ